jgi:signal transduction histidine kinase
MTESVDVAFSSCSLLELNVEDMLALPRIKQGHFTKNITQSDLCKAVEDVKSILKYKCQSLKVTMDSKFLGFQVKENGMICTQVPLDNQRFMQMLMNYASNAVKFIEGGG